MTERDISKNFWKGETIFPLFMLLFVSVLYYDSLYAPPRPMLLPKSVQFILIVLLLVQFFKSLLGPTSKEERSAGEIAAGRKVKWKMFFTFAGMMLFPFSTWLIGYLLTSIVYVLAIILYWGGSKIHHIIIAEIVVIGLIYGVFIKTLDVIFPAGLLFGG